MCNIEDPDLKNICLLISYVGSDPDSTYDIISIKDVCFDDKFTPECIQISSSIMVKCGRAKSLAIVRMISDNTDLLLNELNRLQEKCSNKENIDPLTLTPPKKRKRYSEDSYDSYSPEEREKDRVIVKLTRENQRLKDELNEARKLLDAFCKDIKQVVNGVQKKILEKQENENTILKENSFYKNVENDCDTTISCPVTEMADKVLIGSGKTEIARQIFAQVNWLSYNAATRKLLMAVFSREILATHTLTGKPSPAFLSTEMPSKNRLDPKKVADIIEIVSSKCKVPESLVRNAITTKCADENKMYKKRMEKLEKIKTYPN